MVKYNDDRLDLVFSALSDRTRRGMLARLSEQQALSVSDLAEPLDMSLPAVMKHLGVLADAGLVKRNKTGRIVACRLDAKPMQHANEWLERYQKFWTESFDRLARHLESEQWLPQPSSSPASPSNANTRRHPRGSTKPGPTRKS
ncbi:MAG: helix-turn-helix transcriptional regulator [Pseudolabrys sp.]|nr:helix-turn-helix transcriptional regulator [Pseudolabrys sp.]MBV9261093.1 helix-turn-helix transcriptional regulator [Pseudolabrys sp.]